MELKNIKKLYNQEKDYLQEQVNEKDNKRSEILAPLYQSTRLPARKKKKKKRDSLKYTKQIEI